MNIGIGTGSSREAPRVDLGCATTYCDEDEGDTITATLGDRICELLTPGGQLDDDEIAARLDVVRQRVNQTCRRLEAEGILTREVGARGKIANRRSEMGGHGQALFDALGSEWEPCWRTWGAVREESRPWWN